MNEELEDIELLDESPGEEVEIVEEAPADPKPPKIENKPERSLQNRIDRLTYERHESDRRASEAEARVVEAVRVAQVAVQRHQEAAHRLNSLEDNFKREALGSREAQLAVLQSKFQAARESGDTAAEAAAIAQLGAVSAERQSIGAWMPQKLQPMEMPNIQPLPPARQIDIDATTQDWVDRNDWFKTNEAARNFAIAQEVALSNAGYTPNSKECYDQIDAAMQRHFPELVGSQPASQRSAPNSSKVTSAVVGGNRVNNSASPSNGNRIQLTASQAKTARDLGLDYKVYYDAYVKEHGR